MCWLVCGSLVPLVVPPVPLVFHLLVVSCIASIQWLPPVSSAQGLVAMPVVRVVVLRVCYVVVVVVTRYCLVVW